MVTSQLHDKLNFLITCVAPRHTRIADILFIIFWILAGLYGHNRDSSF